MEGDARWGTHRGKWHHFAPGRQASALRGSAPRRPCMTCVSFYLLTGPDFDGRCHARQRLAREMEGDARWGTHSGKWHHFARGRQASALRGSTPRRRCVKIILGVHPGAPPRRSPLPRTEALFVGRTLLGPFSPVPARVTGRACPPNSMHHYSCGAAGDPLEGPLYPGQWHFSWGGRPSAPSPLPLPESLAGNSMVSPTGTPSRVPSTQDPGTFRGEAAPRPLPPLPWSVSLLVSVDSAGELLHKGTHSRVPVPRTEALFVGRPLLGPFSPAQLSMCLDGPRLRRPLPRKAEACQGDGW